MENNVIVTKGQPTLKTRLVSLLTSIALVFAVFVYFPAQKASALECTMTVNEAINWINQNYSHGQSAGQCMAFVNQYILALCGKYMPAQTAWCISGKWETGSNYDGYGAYNSSTYPFTFIKGGSGMDLRKGDILLFHNTDVGWGNSCSCGQNHYYCGHIAIYESDSRWYDSNRKGDELFRVNTDSPRWSSLYGVLRPNFKAGNNPECYLDNLWADEGTVHVSGWAYDIDAPDTSLEIRVFIGDELHEQLYTTEYREDVNNAFGITGNHGFEFSIPTQKRGQQEVFVHAINVGSGTDHPRATNPSINNVVNIPNVNISKCTVDAIGDQTYTGGAINPAVTVRFGDYTLVQGVDYTVDYSNNVNVGTAAANVTGIGNYCGTKTAYFNITASGDFTVDEIGDQTYTGGAITPAVTVKFGDYTLIQGVDYTVDYSNNVNVGTAAANVTGIGNYCGTKTAYFNITASGDFTVDAIGDQTYTGGAINPAVTVKFGDYTLIQGVDYTVDYSNNVNVGTAAANVTGIGNYCGTKTAYFNITASGDFTVDAIGDQTYTGGAINPAVTVRFGDYTLVQGVDYTVDYSNNVNVGTAAVNVTGIGNYCGTKTAYFNITASGDFTVDAIGDQTYTGGAITPAVTVKFGDYTLVQGVDYTVEYSNNVNVGTAAANVTGIGNYCGTKTAYFNIIKPVSIVPQNLKAVAGDGKVVLTWDAVEGAIAYTVKGGTDATIYAKSIKTNTATVTGLTNGKEYIFRVFAYVDGKWSNASVVRATPYTIVPQNLKATAGDGKVTLTWDKVEGATAYTVKGGTDATIYARSIKTNTATVTGLKNGTTYTFRVFAYVNGKWSAAAAVKATPVTTTPQNLKATAGDGKVVLTWDKVAGATAYTVKGGTDATVYAKSIKSNTATVTGLKNGTTYTFRVFAYVNGKWSAAAAVKATPVTTTPQNLTATVGSKSVTLKWDAVPGATAYTVKGGSDSTIYARSIKSNTATVTGLTNGKEYIFRVFAYAGGKWSAAAVVRATPKA